MLPQGSISSYVADLLVHDETNRGLALLLAALEPPTFPVALGVLYCVADESYEAQVNARLPKESAINRDLKGLLRRGHTWDVDA